MLTSKLKISLMIKSITKITFKNLLPILVFLFFIGISFSQEKNKPYLYGVPPAPPYQEVEVTIANSKTDGCSIAKEPMVGFIISVDEREFDDFKLVVQDEKGARHKCYIDASLTSNYDLSMLKYTLIPGNKVELKVQYCGSGGFIYIMNIKNLKRS